MQIRCFWKGSVAEGANLINISAVYRGQGQYDQGQWDQGQYDQVLNQFQPAMVIAAELGYRVLEEGVPANIQSLPSTSQVGVQRIRGVFTTKQGATYSFLSFDTPSRRHLHER